MPSPSAGSLVWTFPHYQGSYEGAADGPVEIVAAESIFAVVMVMEEYFYGYDIDRPHQWRPWIRVATPGGEQRVTYNAAQGNGGQKVYLFPQFGLVAVITAGAYNVQTPSNALMATAVLPGLVQAVENDE
jgi:hypothetical protein